MQTVKLYRHHLITPKTIVVIFDSGPPSTILATNDMYERVKELLESGQYDLVPGAVDRATAIRKASKGKFVVINGAICIDGVTLPKALSDKLVSFVDAGLDTGALEAFWDNLAENPTESSREDLYAFIEANDIPITPDGHIVVYKKVRNDYFDCHTGRTFECKPGSVITMERDKVDHNREHTCSPGIHVAAWGYAKDFRSGRMMECAVNPRDVVAVPPDYSQQKMRACRVRVLREVNEACEDKVYETKAEPEVQDESVDTTKSVVLISPDKEGRIRLPGKLVRSIGIGVGAEVEVCLEDDADDFLVVRELSDDTTPEYWTSYVVRDDNSVRISQSVLDWIDASGADLEVTQSAPGELRIELG